LAPALGGILDRRPEVRVLLLGAGGDRWREELTRGRPTWADRVTAPGRLSGEAVVEYLRACDLVVQPYPDGASSRRTSLMAPLANGVPVLTTLGPCSEPVWSAGSVAVAPAGRLADAALELLDHPARLVELGEAGRALYDHSFSLRRTVAELLDGQSAVTPGRGQAPAHRAPDGPGFLVT
jgi:glycosyltransferase involved in cell wall biosynthesis